MHDPQQTPAPQARLAHNWRRYLRFFRARPDADVDDELRFHFEMRVRDYMARGMTDSDARAAVMKRLGDVDRVRDECISITTRRQRSMTRAQTLDGFGQDLVFTTRMLARQKGWTTIAILTLALGIGANTAVFSAVNSLVLNPLPYPDTDRLVLMAQEPTSGRQSGVNVSIQPNSEVVRAWLGARSFESVQAMKSSEVTLEIAGQSSASVRAGYVQPTFPAFAGARVVAGRMFSEQETTGNVPVALLGERTWQTRFGSDPNAIGSSITINDRQYSVIGVLPAELQLPQIGGASMDVWLPLAITRDAFGLSVIGRLRAGMDRAAAARELDTLAARTRSSPGNEGLFRARLTPPREMLSFRDSLWMLSGAVGLVMLIACTNVAHLLLARSAARQRELAIRTALGAGRGRLFRQLLTESLVLALAGCAAGLAVGWLGLEAVVRLRPESLSALSAAKMDITALLATVAVAVVTGVAFGVFAAVQAAKQSTHESLKAGMLTTSQVRGHRRLRSLLVVTEMALSTTLLVGAGLLVRSVIHLQTVDPGFEPRGLVTLQAGLPAARYPTDASRSAFYSQLAERARSLPGVEEVSVADAALPGYNFLVGALHVEGQEAPPKGTTSLIRYNAVTADFFRTVGMRIVEGTAFTDTTRGRQMMINEGFAKKYWPAGSAVGRRVRVIRFDGKGDWETVVGVVADAATGGLTAERSEPVLYLPGAGTYSPDLIVRARPETDVLPALRSLVSSIDPRLPPPKIINVERAMAESASRPRFMMLLLVIFTALALALAAIGLYGVMTYGVAQRTREIGIRIALGATRQNVARDVVSSGLVLALGGVALGLAGAWWSTKLVEAMLYGVPRTDPLSFVAAGTVLLGTALVACIVPMNRAASVDPIIAMRTE